MAGAFPISIQKSSALYKEGSSNKEYHVCLIDTADGRSLLIKRWGKANTWGQTQSMRGSKQECRRERDKHFGQKLKDGYEQTNNGQVTAMNEQDFLTKLGTGYYHKLGIDFDYILPGCVPIRANSGATPAFVEAKVAPPSEAERYAQNPAWGAF